MVQSKRMLEGSKGRMDPVETLLCFLMGMRLENKNLFYS